MGYSGASCLGSESSRVEAGRTAGGSPRPETPICGGSSWRPSWSYRYRPAVGAPRCASVRRDWSKEVKAIAWKAQTSASIGRYVRQLTARGKVQAPKAVTAVGRELLGFIWAIGVRGGEPTRAARGQQANLNAGNG